MKDSCDKVSRSLLGLVLFTLLSFGSGFKVQGSGFRVEVAVSLPFLLRRCPPVSFLPWDFIHGSLAFSSIVVYNKSSECHCFSRETLIKSDNDFIRVSLGAAF